MTHVFNEHQLIKTEDGTTTLFSKKYQENCHSLSGATAETEFHYLQGCQVLEAVKGGPLNLLEVGLGTGIGLFLTMEKILNLEEHYPATLHSLEESQELIDHFAKCLNQEYSPLNLRQAEENSLFNHYTNKNKNLSVIIIKGDARKSLLQYSHSRPMQLNAIYQDAFSPKKNPTLWTVEWFKDLKNLSAENCKLSTYSSSISIQKALVEAGWKIHNGGPFGQKRSCTRAQLTGSSSAELLTKINQSSVLSLTDARILKD